MYKDNKGNVSAFVYELAKKSEMVSLNYNALDKIKKYGRIIGFESVFNEIKWINPNTDILNKLKTLPKVNMFMSTAEWADLFINNLKNWFLENLKEGQKYWLLHSSGGDSRILSGILALLKQEGYKWNVKFVSWFPEAEMSYRILKFLGWDDEDIWLVGSEKKLNPESYWNESNFYIYDEIGIITNGEIMPFGSAQSFFWKTYFKDVKEINIIMALMGDVIMGALPWWRRMKRYKVLGMPFLFSENFKINTLIAGTTRWNGLGVLGYLKDFNDLLVPTMNFEMVHYGISVPYLRRRNDILRKTIQEKIKKGLSRIPNANGVWVKKNKDLFKKIWSDYYNSYFYGETHIDDNVDVGNGVRVPIFLSLASLIDALKKDNVKIKL